MEELIVQIKKEDRPKSSVLDRRSVIPLYHQLAGQLKQKIHAGDYKDCEFPTGRALAKKYGVSDIVVRHAISNLKNSGLLTSERGRGTYISRSLLATKKDSKRTGRIGLALSWEPDTLFSPLLPAMEKIASEAGFQMVLVNNQGNPKIERNRIRELIDNGIDGLFWMPTDEGPTIAFANKVLGSVSVLIAIDRQVNVSGDRANLVEADNFGGMEEMVEYLVSKGHRRIAYAHKSFECSTIKERYQGYSKALRYNGIVPSDEWVFTSNKAPYECGLKCAEQILKSKFNFDSICCDNDTTAIGVLDFLREKGVKVPDDIAVTGFNDNRESSMVTPKLTTVHIDSYELGVKAIELMLSRISAPKQDKLEPVHITVPVKLVVRESA